MIKPEARHWATTYFTAKVMHKAPHTFSCISHLSGISHTNQALCSPPTAFSLSGRGCHTMHMHALNSQVLMHARDKLDKEPVGPDKSIKGLNCAAACKPQ